MSLSVCLLTRNDAATVAAAVASVREVADEVLVADTGSTDGTVEAAAGAGASVSQFAWEDDFAAGRNHLVARARRLGLARRDGRRRSPDPESRRALRLALGQ
jgi:glycosyltransferase involved in cell wall biosynthesis